MKGYEQVQDELKKIGIVFILAYAFFQIHYYKESLVTVVRLTFAYFYLFVIPGYALLLYYMHKIQFSHRLFMGTVLGFAVQGLIGFIITLVFHINLKEYYLFISPILIVLGWYVGKKEVLAGKHE